MFRRNREGPAKLHYGDHVILSGWGETGDWMQVGTVETHNRDHSAYKVRFNGEVRCYLRDELSRVRKYVSYDYGGYP